MKHLILFLCCALLTLGCDSETEATPEGLSFEGDPTVTLTGGSRWFEPSDTGTYYDAHVQCKFTNTTDKTKLIKYELMIGLDNNGVIETSTLRSRSGVVVVHGTYTADPNTQVTIDQNHVMDIARPEGNWSKPYRYVLRVYEEGGSSSYIFQGIVPESHNRNRFCGIFFTVEVSPDPLGIMDGPDDNDYASGPNDWMQMDPVYPNPCTLNAVLNFLVRDAAAVEFDILRTPKTHIYRESMGVLEAGYYQVGLPLDSLEPGQYRVVVRSVLDGRTITARGDIIKTLN